MTLREWFTGWDVWWDTFWMTVTTTSPLDWPLSYFGYIIGGGWLAFVAIVMILGNLSLLFDR